MLTDSQLALSDFTFHELKDILNIFICCTFRALDPRVFLSSTENPLPEDLDLILEWCRIMGLLLKTQQDLLHGIVLISTKLVWQ